MEQLVKGDVVALAFPFAEMDEAKRRPALVLARLRGDDLIVCMITSKPPQDHYALDLRESDFTEGSLRRPSYLCPNRLFTVASSVVHHKIGRIDTQKVGQVVVIIKQILDK